MLVDVPTSQRSNDVELSTKGYGRLADDDDVPASYRDSAVDVRELYDGYGMGFDSERQRHSAYDLAALRDAAEQNGEWGRPEREREREHKFQRDRFVRPRMERSSTAPQQFRSNNPFANAFDHEQDGSVLERKERPPPVATPAWAWDSEKSPTSSTSSARHR